MSFLKLSPRTMMSIPDESEQSRDLLGRPQPLPHAETSGKPNEIRLLCFLSNQSRESRPTRPHPPPEPFSPATPRDNPAALTVRKRPTFGQYLYMQKSRMTGSLHYSEILAEGEGFEPPKPCGSPVFKTSAFNLSAIPPNEIKG